MKKTSFFAAILLLSGAFLRYAYAQPSPLPSDLVEKPVFRESGKSSVMIRPHFTDSTTNVAFYLDIDGKMWWQAEQLGSLGDLPFVSYWAPMPVVGSYVAVEYVNDHQQFSCSGLSLGDCLSDPRFVAESAFQVVDDSAVIDPPVTLPPSSSSDLTAGIAQALFELDASAAPGANAGGTTSAAQDSSASSTVSADAEGEGTTTSTF